MLKLLGEKDSIDLFDSTIVKGEIIFTLNKVGENNQPRRKYLLKNNLLENTPSIFNYGSSDDNFFKSINLNFPYAKPVDVAKYFINSIHPNPKVVLDFFAGSGTTLHAILELNDEGKNINGIIVTNNEVDVKTEGKLKKLKIESGSEEYENEGICRKITFPRIKMLIEGFKTVDEKLVDGFISNNLRYYKCDFVDRKPTLSNKRKLTKLATELLCIKEDVYQEMTSLIMQADWNKLFSDGKGGYVYLVYDDFYIDDAVEALEVFIETHQPKDKVKVYVFSNGQYAYSEEFESLTDKVTLAALPDAIYKALAQVLPKENKEVVPELEEDFLNTESETTIKS
jgi:adenine-specific DNA-methyltransferase